MKIKTDVRVSRCEAGNVDVRITVRIEVEAGYSNQPKGPVLGAIDHTLDGCRKAVKDALTESRPRP